jgi:hypothetical protein
MSSVKWKGTSVEVEKILDHVFPAQRLSWIEDLSTGITQAKKTLETIKKPLNLVLGLISTVGVDLIGALFVNLVKLVKKAVADILSIGASTIIIHPFNAKDPKKLDLGLGKLSSPLDIPSLTPVEAFEQLKDSFLNTSDPYRPVWKKDVKTVGFGVLLTTGSPVDLSLLLKAFHLLTDWDEFIKPATKLAEAATSFAKDVSENKMPIVEEDAEYRKAETAESGEASTSFTLLDDVRVSSAGINDEPWNQALFPSDEEWKAAIPDLHWRGVTLGNIVYLRQAANALTTFLDSLVEMYGATTVAAQGLVKALINKVEALFKLVTQVLEALQGLATALPTSGIYIFTIPLTPSGTDGGVQYLIDSLKFDDATAATTGVDKTLSNPFSALVFCAAGGLDAEYWAELGAEIQAQIAEIKRRAPLIADAETVELIPSVNVDSSAGDEVFPPGRISFHVLSTSEDSVSNPYYMWQLSSRWEAQPLIAFNTTADALVGSTPLTFSAEDKTAYTLRVTTYDYLSPGVRKNEQTRDFFLAIDSERSNSNYTATEFAVCGVQDGRLYPYSYPAEETRTFNLETGPLATHLLSPLPFISYEYTLSGELTGIIFEGESGEISGSTKYYLPSIYHVTRAKMRVTTSLETGVLGVTSDNFTLEIKGSSWAGTTTKTLHFSISSSVSGAIGGPGPISVGTLSSTPLPLSDEYEGSVDLFNSNDALIDSGFTYGSIPVIVGSGVQRDDDYSLRVVTGNEARLRLCKDFEILTIDELTDIIYVPSFPCYLAFTSELGSAMYLLFDGIWKTEPLTLYMRVDEETFFYCSLLEDGVWTPIRKIRVLLRSVEEGICS